MTDLLREGIIVHKILWVKWRDAATEPGPRAANELTPPPVLESVGFLVGINKDWVAIAADYCPEEDRYREITYIPIGMVVAKKIVK